MAVSHIKRLQMMQMAGQQPQGPFITPSIASGSGSNPPSLIGGASGTGGPSYGNYNSYPRPASSFEVGMRSSPVVGGNREQHSVSSMGPAPRPGSVSTMGATAGNRPPPAAGVGSVSTVPGGYRYAPPGSVSGMGYRTNSRSSLGGGMGYRTGSRSSLGGGLAGTSRSLRASKASLASVKSGKSTIQQEAHDRSVQHQLRAPWFGPGKMPFTLAIVFFFIALAVMVTGLTILFLRLYGQLFLTVDKSEIIGPILIAGSFIFVGLGVKFMYDAYTVGSRQRGRTKFHAASASMVTAHAQKGKQRYKTDQTETLLSGTASKNAITRTPLGSRVSLSDMM